MATPQVVGNEADTTNLQALELRRLNTDTRMELQSMSGLRGVALQWCLSGVMCFWIPMIFFMAAANTLTSCEKELDTFMKVYSLSLIIVTPTISCMALIFASIQSKICFKVAERLQVVTGFAHLGLEFWGWVIWANTTDQLCYDPTTDHTHAINPRTLTFVFLVVQACLLGCIFLALCCAPGAALVAGAARRAEG